MPFKERQGKKTKYPGIFKTGQNQFLVRARWTDPKTGKRKTREAVVDSEDIQDAIKKLAQVKGVAPSKPGTRPLFKSFAKQWLKKHSAKRELAPSTKARYINALAHLSATFGDYFVDAIDKESIEEWQVESKKDNSNYTVNGWLRVLRLVLDRAVDQQLVASNAARRTPTLKEGRTKGARGVSFTLPEFREFIRVTQKLQGESVSEDVARQILIIAWTGMRMGESLALQFDHVDGNELRIERSVWGRIEKETKTDDPRRVTMVGPLKEVIAEQRKWLVTTQHPGLASGLIFPANPGAARAGSRASVCSAC